MCVFRALSSDIIGLFSRPAFNCIFLAHIQLFLKCEVRIFIFFVISVVYMSILRTFVLKHLFGKTLFPYGLLIAYL